MRMQSALRRTICARCCAAHIRDLSLSACRARRAGQRVNVDAADSKGTTALMNCAEAEGQSGVAVAEAPRLTCEGAGQDNPRHVILDTVGAAGCRRRPLNPERDGADGAHVGRTVRSRWPRQRCVSKPGPSATGLSAALAVGASSRRGLAGTARLRSSRRCWWPMPTRMSIATRAVMWDAPTLLRRKPSQFSVLHLRRLPRHRLCALPWARSGDSCLPERRASACTRLPTLRETHTINRSATYCIAWAQVLEAFNEPDWVGWLPPPLRATAVHAVRMVPVRAQIAVGQVAPKVTLPRDGGWSPAAPASVPPLPAHAQVGSRIWGNPMLLSALVVAALRLGLHWAFGLLSERATAS